MGQERRGLRREGGCGEMEGFRIVKGGIQEEDGVPVDGLWGELFGRTGLDGVHPTW